MFVMMEMNEKKKMMKVLMTMRETRKTKVNGKKRRKMMKIKRKMMMMMVTLMMIMMITCSYGLGWFPMAPGPLVRPGWEVSLGRTVLPDVVSSCDPWIMVFRDV